LPGYQATRRRAPDGVVVIITYLEIDDTLIFILSLICQVDECAYIQHAARLLWVSDLIFQ